MISTPETTDLSRVPLDYHDFTDMLAPHHEHDLKINLEDGTSLPLGATYSLSSSELNSLCEFLDENLTMGFIHPSSSAHAAPVLFVHKKDGSLRLCVNFQGLNKITKKDRCPLPLISNLLDTPSYTKVYTKINLQHAYHLVHIADGD